MTVTSSATVALRSMAAAGAQPRSLRVRVCGAARAGRGRPAQLGAPAARGDARPSGAARASRRRAARRWLATSAASVPEPSAPAAAPLGLDAALRYTSFVVPLAVLVALDKYLEAAVAAQGISFPAPLIGMFCLFGALLVLERAAPKAGLALSGFCAPAVQWITRWLPLFFVPSLVTLPLAVQGLSAAQGAKLMAILLPGWAFSCLVTGATVQWVRGLTNTSLLPYTPPAPPAPFSKALTAAWWAVGAAGFAMCAAAPTALMGSAGVTAAPALLASTVLGYIYGTQMPAAVRSVLHPILITALAGQAGCMLYGFVTGTPFLQALTVYKTGSLFGAPGAGDIFMGFLGSVILSFAFSMYAQRKLMLRHWREIVSAVGISALFSTFSTAALGRVLGLGPELTLTVVPRCITVALALPMADLLGVADPSLTAAAVVLTGLIGANFAQALLNGAGFKDPISRGMAVAGSAHGLGTAALAPKEPETLPFCAIAQALIGIASSCLVAVPAVRAAVFAIAGA